MRFQDTHTSLPITRAEEHKCTRLKLEEGVLLALEDRHRVEEEEEEHAQLEAEEETCLVEEARLKYEGEEQARCGPRKRHAFPKKQGKNLRNISVQG